MNFIFNYKLNHVKYFILTSFLFCLSSILQTNIAQTTKIFQAPTNAVGNCRGYEYECGCGGSCNDCRHAGIDYCGSTQDDIKAVGSGRVCAIHQGNSRGLGRTVILAHKMPNRTNIYSLYSHLNNIDSDVTVGKYLTKGFVLGKKGRTGSGAGTRVHLHFEMKNHCGLGHNVNCIGSGCVGYVAPNLLPVSSRGYFNPNDYINNSTRSYADISLNSYLPTTIPKSNVNVATSIYSPFTEQAVVDIRLALYTTSGNYLGPIQTHYNRSLQSGYNTVTFVKTNMSSTPGNYKLQVDYRVRGSANWIPLPINNNFQNPRNTTLISNPDVYVTNQYVNDNSVTIGQTITIHARQNISPSSTPYVNTYIRYLFSTDQYASSNDIYIGTDVSSLGNGDAYDNENINFTIPNVASGTRYIIIWCDYPDDVNESNENNNISVIPIQVSGSQTNAQLALTTFNSGTYLAGNTYPIRWNSSGSFSYVRLEYSTNGGNSWNSIGWANRTLGTYNWRIPTHVNTSLGRIRISDWYDSSTKDVSNSNLRFNYSGGGSLNNDNPCGATTLPVANYCNSVVGNNTNATTTTNPNTSVSGCEHNNTPSKDIWFKATVPSSGYLTIRTTAGSLNDAVMAIYQGSCSGLEQVSGVCEDDNENGSLMPVVNLIGPPGAVAYIRVWGYGGATGTFSICALNYQSSNKDGSDTANNNENVDIRNITELPTPEPTNSALEGAETKTTVHLYPNPIARHATLTVEVQNASIVELYDITGRKMISQTIGTTDKTAIILPLEDWNIGAGTYLVRVLDENRQSVQSQKLVVY